MTLSVIFLIAVLFLLALHLSHRGLRNKSTYRKLKTWMLILMSLYAIVNAVRYVFFIRNMAQFLPILVSCLMLHSLIIYLISFFYVEKALHLSEETQTIKKVMLYSVAAFLTFYLAVWIYDLKNYTALMMSDLC